MEKEEELTFATELASKVSSLLTGALGSDIFKNGYTYVFKIDLEMAE